MAFAPTPPNAYWCDLPKEAQQRLTAAIAQLGFAMTWVAQDSMVYQDKALGACFTPGVRFEQGMFWGCPTRVTVEDLAHEVGHAFQLSPAERATFAVADSDLETPEPGTMVVQWALLRAMDPTYPVGASLKAFGYGFMGHAYLSDHSGQNWQQRLEHGVVVPSEANTAFALAELGLMPTPRALYLTLHDEDNQPETDPWGGRFTADVVALPVLREEADVLTFCAPPMPTRPRPRRRAP